MATTDDEKRQLIEYAINEIANCGGIWARCPNSSTPCRNRNGKALYGPMRCQMACRESVFQAIKRDHCVGLSDVISVIMDTSVPRTPNGELTPWPWEHDCKKYLPRVGRLPQGVAALCVGSNTEDQ